MISAEYFIDGLKSRNEDIRLKTAIALQRHINTEVQEISSEISVKFMNDINQHLQLMVTGSDLNDLKGGLLGIMSLLDIFEMNQNQLMKFSISLRDVFYVNDVAILEISAAVVGRIAAAASAEQLEHITYHYVKALEWLNEEISEFRRRASVLIVTQLSKKTPTLFYMRIQRFFAGIFNVVFDYRQGNRERAVEAIEGALMILVQRELKDSQLDSPYYQECFDKLFGVLQSAANDRQLVNRDDKVHGALLLLDEILKLCNFNVDDVEEFSALRNDHTEKNKSQLSKQIETSSKVLSSTNLHSNLHKIDDFDEVSKAPLSSKICISIIRRNYKKLMELVMRHLTSKNLCLQSILIKLIPRLASFDTESFQIIYFKDVFKFLFNCIKKDRARHSAFNSIAVLCHVMNRNHVNMTIYVDEVITSIKYYLPMMSKRYRNTELEESVYTSILVLAKIDSFSPPILDVILPLLFTFELSEALINTLYRLSRVMTSYTPFIHDGILNRVRRILLTPTSTDDVINAEAMTLSLRMLASFRFLRDKSVTSFELPAPFDAICREVASDRFLQHDSQQVRLNAVAALISLLQPMIPPVYVTPRRAVIHPVLSRTLAGFVSRVLKLLVTDDDVSVRLQVLRSLDNHFDCYLILTENLKILVMALHEEDIEVRQRALASFARLSELNPAYVIPVLRRVLMQLINELKFSGIGRNKLHAVNLISQIATNAPKFMQAHALATIQTLIEKLKNEEQTATVAVGIMKTIGELSHIGGIFISSIIDEILPTVIEMLENVTCFAKRQAALVTLGKVIQSTGYVVTPYHKYPSLKDTLLKFVNSETSQQFRIEVMRVLGLLGIHDPYKHQPTPGASQFNLIKKPKVEVVIQPNEDTNKHNLDSSVSELIVSYGNVTDDYYTVIAVKSLMLTLSNPQFESHHRLTIQAIKQMFLQMSVKCIPFLKEIIPTYLEAMKRSTIDPKTFYLTELSSIVVCVKQHVRSYAGKIILAIEDFWKLGHEVQRCLLDLIKVIAEPLSASFKSHLPILIPHFIRILEYDTSPGREVTLRLLDAIEVFGVSLDDYITIILPSMLKQLKSPQATSTLRNAILMTLQTLANDIDLSFLMSHIIHLIIYVIDNHPDNHSAAMEALCATTKQFGANLELLIPRIRKSILRHRINHVDFEVALTQITEHEVTDVCLWESHKSKNFDTLKFSTVSETPRKPISNYERLQKYWTINRQVSKDDWISWLNLLMRSLLKESPSIALKSCNVLATSFPLIAKNLFNAGFLSIWLNLHESQQDDLISCIEQALTAADCPPEVIHTLLNLAEFMEHTDVGTLPMNDDYALLGETAWRCSAYAKALHYKEQEFHKRPSDTVIGDLINIYTKLGQPEAADGVLVYHKKMLANIGEQCQDLNVEWYERLHKWDEAKKMYQRKLNSHSDYFRSHDDPEINVSFNFTQKLGYLRSLEALGEWDDMYEYTEANWPKNSLDERRQMARLAASAAWGLHKWDKMDEYTCVIPRNEYDGMLYRAVIAVHQQRYSLARKCIGEAREILDCKLTALASESHTRAYPALINCQLLSELEEAISYKLEPERASVVRKAWWDRLQDMDKNLEDWQRIIQVRSLVVDPHEGVHTLLKFTNLCHKHGRMKLAHQTLLRLLRCDPEHDPEAVLPSSQPHVSVAYLKHMWKKSNLHKNKSRALDGLLQYVSTIKYYPTNICGSEFRQEMKHLLAKCYLRLGRWHQELNGFNEKTIPDIISYFKSCTEQDEYWYKAWYSWAMANFESVNFYKNRIQSNREKVGALIQIAIQDQPECDDIDELAASTDDVTHLIDLDVIKPHQKAISNDTSEMVKFASTAVYGFFKSISLCELNSLQDCLRVITLWFDHGNFTSVNEKVKEGIKSIQIEHWLQVIPQLIARIASPKPAVASLLHELLTNIGKEHPQSIIYSLAVASKAEKQQQHPANKILNKMCEHSAELVQQTIMVSEELIRVAILWHESWHGGLEEASRLYFAERDIDGMLNILEPLHIQLDRGATTLKEKSFNQAYGRDLKDARDLCKSYKMKGDVKELNQAWDLYYQVFRRITKQLPQLTTLGLDYVSPKLLACCNLDLAVPGTYEPGRPIICIRSVNPTLHVIASKQRPRKLVIRGSDGKEHSFLLKGHEDLRQDERVMQLFGLINTLLASDAQCNRKNLNIQKLSVVPLSMNSGLIGWVPNCDTFHFLIREYREKKRILLNIEHRIMLKMAPDYDHLPLLHKVEVFEHAINNTAGDDLAKLLWLKSPTSEDWLVRRTNYTRSLAVMSMVGYVLGLGDRHPSNLMLDRVSGKVLHIDFGDCFEVAMAREKFPEKIPFRLTRMLVNAMEVTGIEGNYKHVCHKTMDVLRHNRESIMAVLEAFVYDPLLNWRLMEDKNSLDLENKSPSNEESLATIVTRLLQIDMEDSSGVGQEVINKRALKIVNRVRDKLTGCDFGNSTVDIPTQVDLLISQATSCENLCQCYIGWCSFW